jgi:3-mercaptopyruvate sulfurtransferase SseA
MADYSVRPAYAASSTGYQSARRAEGAEPASALQVAALLALAAVVIYYATTAAAARKRERFVSEQALEVHARAREVFEAKGLSATYSEYKGRVPGADPVQYGDVRRLFSEGRLSPQAVEAVL